MTSSNQSTSLAILFLNMFLEPTNILVIVQFVLAFLLMEIWMMMREWISTSALAGIQHLCYLDGLAWQWVHVVRVLKQSNMHDYGSKLLVAVTSIAVRPKIQRSVPVLLLLVALVYSSRLSGTSAGRFEAALRNDRTTASKRNKRSIVSAGTRLTNQFLQIQGWPAVWCGILFWAGKVDASSLDGEATSPNQVTAVMSMTESLSMIPVAATFLGIASFSIHTRVKNSKSTFSIHSIGVLSIMLLTLTLKDVALDEGGALVFEGLLAVLKLSLLISIVVTLISIARGRDSCTSCNGTGCGKCGQGGSGSGGA